MFWMCYILFAEGDETTALPQSVLDDLQESIKEQEEKSKKGRHEVQIVMTNNSTDMMSPTQTTHAAPVGDMPLEEHHSESEH